MRVRLMGQTDPVPAAYGQKSLPSPPGFRYNPYSLQASGSVPTRLTRRGLPSHCQPVRCVARVLVLRSPLPNAPRLAAGSFTQTGAADRQRWAR